jgi:hypothetical protein
MHTLDMASEGSLPTPLLRAIGCILPLSLIMVLVHANPRFYPAYSTALT